MQTNVDVIEEKNVVDIQDLSSFTLDINDATLSGTITVLDDKATFTDNTINTTTVVNTITLPSDSDTTIEIVSPIAEKISVEKLVTNVVEIDFANALFAQGQATTAERLQNPININERVKKGLEILNNKQPSIFCFFMIFIVSEAQF